MYTGMTIPHTVDAKVHFFASHSWTHSHRREGLHAILRPWARGVDFEDYSISRAHPLNTETDPELGRELCDIIYGMDALLIMAGMYANNSPWMQFEIDTAFAFKVPIIPILAYGQQKVPRLPTRLATFPPIRWRGDSIREALLRCISPERRQVIEGRVAYRVAVAAEEAERKRRAAEAARRAPTYSRPVSLPLMQSLPMLPLPRNTLADYLDPQPMLPTNSLSDLLRRR
jgi:antiphage defense system Thoeris ThsB-like protein